MNRAVLVGAPLAFLLAAAPMAGALSSGGSAAVFAPASGGVTVGQDESVDLSPSTTVPDTSPVTEAVDVARERGSRARATTARAVHRAADEAPSNARTANDASSPPPDGATTSTPSASASLSVSVSGAPLP